MVKHSKLIFSLILIAILGVGVYYLLQTKKPTETPYRTFTPPNYPEGTKVAHYRNAPPGFPSEVILETETLKYSGVVVSPQGKEQITVSYISQKSLPEVVSLYAASFPGNGFTLIQNNLSTSVATFYAERGENMLGITISKLKAGQTNVTFQYE